MPKPDLATGTPMMTLTKLVVVSGDKHIELDGSGISLNSPAVYDLIQRVLGASDASQQAQIDALAKTAQDNAATLTAAVAANQPTP